MVQTPLNRSVYEAWAREQPESERPTYEDWSADKIKKLVIDAIKSRAPKGVRIDFVDQHKGDPYVVIPPGTNPGTGGIEVRTAGGPSGELLFAIVQRLQTQLPAMQLNRQLIDVTGHFGSLRFVLFQFPLNFVQLRCSIGGWFDRFGNGRQFPAALAG